MLPHGLVARPPNPAALRGEGLGALSTELRRGLGSFGCQIRPPMVPASRHDTTLQPPGSAVVGGTGASPTPGAKGGSLHPYPGAALNAEGVGPNSGSPDPVRPGISRPDRHSEAQDDPSRRAGAPGFGPSPPVAVQPPWGRVSSGRVNTRGEEHPRAGPCGTTSVRAASPTRRLSHHQPGGQRASSRPATRGESPCMSWWGPNPERSNGPSNPQSRVVRGRGSRQAGRPRHTTPQNLSGAP